MSDFDTTITVSVSDAWQAVPPNYPSQFTANLTPRCYLCDSPNALQVITVGKRAGKHVCGGCLDGALRSVDGE